MGFKDGYSGFFQENEELKKFMKAHGMAKRCDLIAPRYGLPIICLQPRQVSDRLFLSGKTIPKRIFTGYDVNWGGINNRYYLRNPWNSSSQQESEGLLYSTVTEASKRDGKLLEAAVEFCRFRIQGASNLLSDLLVDCGSDTPETLKVVPTIYKHGKMSLDDFNREKEKYREAAQIFRAWINRSEEGWVKVIPYNKSLIFLKGMNGDYDFLLPGFRDEAFDHQPFAPYLQIKELPKSNDAYHFKRWLYFEYQGWLEQDEHDSEVQFYKHGSSIEYPG